MKRMLNNFSRKHWWRSKKSNGTCKQENLWMRHCHKDENYNSIMSLDLENMMNKNEDKWPFIYNSNGLVMVYLRKPW